MIVCTISIVPEFLFLFKIQDMHEHFFENMFSI